ncbi:MAG: CHAT domain-containing protein, partial [Betaproteobacteria bacterium]
EDRLTGRRKQADDEITYYEYELSQKFPDYLSLIKPKPLTLLEMRRRLGAQEGVVSFLVGRKEAFVTLIRRDGIFIGEVKETEKSLTDAVTALRRGLEIQGTTVIDFDLERSHQLYKSLFGEVEQQLKGLTHLVVAPTGALASLPFSILVTQPAKINRYREAAWLVQQASISHVPSLNAFFSLRTIDRPVKPEKKLFAVGNPALSGKSQRVVNPNASPLATSCRQEGPVSPELISSLLPLPDTESEIASVSRALGVTGKDHLLVGRNATEEAFRNQSLEDYRVLYFATHGLLPGELKCQTEPGLVLTPPDQSTDRQNDGLLEASEIAAMRVNADLVVLSACNTAGAGGRFGGDALSGLAESFFFAGARNLLVSHWQVPSAATTQLMSTLFESAGVDLNQGISPSLQVAQRRMINSEKTAHPFFWGAFVLVGDGAPEIALPLPRGTAVAAAVSTTPTPAGPGNTPR